ncbi:ATP-grasp domain-containing protein [Roseburia hominis]
MQHYFRRSRPGQEKLVTVDIARREDGFLIIMEFGDGQVSGLQQLEAERFYRAFRI